MGGGFPGGFKSRLIGGLFGGLLGGLFGGFIGGLRGGWRGGISAWGSAGDCALSMNTAETRNNPEYYEKQFGNFHRML